MLTTQYQRLWEHQAFHATLIAHWRRCDLDNCKSIFKRKAHEADLGCSDRDEDSDSTEDEIDIPEDDELPSDNDAMLNDIVVTQCAKV